MGITVQTVGEEKQPLVILDNAVANPQALIEHAKTLQFRKLSPTYPGVRAAAPNSFLQEVMPKVLRSLHDQFGYRQGVKATECFYSGTTTPPDQLIPMQRLPHFDGIGDGKVAMLLYLCGPEKAATHLFRHRKTGFETITQDRFETYKQTVADEHGKGENLPARYPEDSDDSYEKIATVEAKFNRLVMYRGVNLHSVGLGPEFSFEDTDPLQRLTVNTFLVPTA